MHKVKAFAKSILKDQKARFILVGILNTAFGYLVYSLFIYIGMHYFAAQFFGSILAIAHSYLWNKYYTFKSVDKSFSEVARYFSVYIVSYLVNMLLLYVFVEFFKISAYIAGLAGLFITMLMSYVGHKKVSFRQKNQESGADK